MNLVLLRAAELAADGTAELTGRRARHLAQVLRAAPGDRVAVGVLGGRMGRGEIVALEGGRCTLRVTLDRDPPPRAPVDLVLALPRPKILRKVLAAAASMGVGKLALVGSYKVEKSYWDSPLLAPEAVAEELALGLEQAKDTRPPEVLARRFFKPFVEDELDAFCGGARRLLAHVGDAPTLDRVAPAGERAVVAIGPEGGWTEYEARRLEELGFAPFSLGPRVLRVDVAVPCAVAQAALWLGYGTRNE